MTILNRNKLSLFFPRVLKSGKVQLESQYMKNIVKSRFIVHMRLTSNSQLFRIQRQIWDKWFWPHLRNTNTEMRKNSFLQPLVVKTEHMYVLLQSLQKTSANPFGITSYTSLIRMISHLQTSHRAELARGKVSQRAQSHFLPTFLRVSRPGFLLENRGQLVPVSVDFSLCFLYNWETLKQGKSGLYDST